MLKEKIRQRVKEIMLTGINRYADKLNIDSKQVQIKITNNPSGAVFYDICDNFKAKERVSLLNIMGKKIDLLGEQSMANPYMKKSLELCAMDYNVDISDISAFVLKHDGEIVLAFYNKFKNFKTIYIEKHLEEIGL